MTIGAAVVAPIPATAGKCAEAFGRSDDALRGMQADRERLTARLRTLAAGLDEIDRRLSGLEWDHRGRRPTQPGPCPERTALEKERAALNNRLRELARHLEDLDRAMSALKDRRPWPSNRVGVCPHCGYPSIDSALCAGCRATVTR